MLAAVNVSDKEKEEREDEGRDVLSVRNSRVVMREVRCYCRILIARNWKDVTESSA
jgi:hypothetical protein